MNRSAVRKQFFFHFIFEENKDENKPTCDWRWRHHSRSFKDSGRLETPKMWVGAAAGSEVKRGERVKMGPAALRGTGYPARRNSSVSRSRFHSVPGIPTEGTEERRGVTFHWSPREVHLSSVTGRRHGGSGPSPHLNRKRWKLEVCSSTRQRSAAKTNLPSAFARPHLILASVWKPWMIPSSTEMIRVQPDICDQTLWKQKIQSRASPVFSFFIHFVYSPFTLLPVMRFLTHIWGDGVRKKTHHTLDRPASSSLKNNTKHKKWMPTEVKNFSKFNKLSSESVVVI